MKKIIKIMYDNIDLIVMWLLLVNICFLLFKFDNLKLRVFNLENEVSSLKNEVKYK